jgi:hypothetical protein
MAAMSIGKMTEMSFYPGVAGESYAYASAPPLSSDCST